jgi:FixJ family two-component response regulator
MRRWVFAREERRKVPGETHVEVRLLLVEEDVAVRRAYCRTLASPGVNVEAVSNGSDVITRVATGSFDVILSDMSMPEMTGVDLLAAVRTTDLDVPVIFQGYQFGKPGRGFVPMPEQRAAHEPRTGAGMGSQP